MAVSVRDVAEQAGVSVGTVSNVLNNPEKVAAATAERVIAAIEALGFVRNDAARQLRAGASRSIGLVVLDVGNPFFTDVARGVEERAAEEGLVVLLANSDERRDREAAHLDLFEEQRVRGLLITPVGEVGERLHRLRARGIPTVLVDRLAGEGFSSVSVDDVAGGRLAAQHLLDTGRRRLGFVGGPLELGQVRDRLRGAREAVAEVPDARLDVLETPGLSMTEGVSAGRRVLEQEPRCDAVLAANDVVALGVLQGLLLGGVRVPHDVALVGYDDIDFAAAAAVPITSIRQPRERMGAEALGLLLAELDGDERHRQIVFQPELVVRESTAAR
ncbi:LacI family DNA-binding transcriptional regulator [Amnibacterium sp. CER49]|uniref:LacI family DNA-binding transcriptional regulator n=1 Tax=Amnibacterium sp. CER49 TaxID=3039161 RepID=UPI002449C0AA|nr:LacI family DNA-binding transcriptional regulator [Amnibacterium sp. CER49]MDH2443146.1 LacI family DNA-binding transcriptional regulator [Amnibacterium sp. CER49]